MSKRKHWTAEEVEKHYKEKKMPVPDSVSSAIKGLQGVGLGSFLRNPDSSLPTISLDNEKGIVQEKSEGTAVVVPSMRVKNVCESLNKAMINVSKEYDKHGNLFAVSIWADGASLLAVNELFSGLQTKGTRFKIFSYKKACHKLIERAVLLLRFEDGKRPQKVSMEGPLILHLHRQGKRLADLDGLPVMFKYLTDGLRKGGVIEDDNPRVIVDVKLTQKTIKKIEGHNAIGIRIERAIDWKGVDSENLKEKWLNKKEL